jgi:hypothetical protein
MQAAIIKSTIDVTRLMAQLQQQRQAQEAKYEHMEKKTVEINLETAAKAPDRGEAIDTKG